MISSAGVQSDGATFYGDEALFDDEMFNGTEKRFQLISLITSLLV